MITPVLQSLFRATAFVILCISFAFELAIIIYYLLTLNHRIYQFLQLYRNKAQLAISMILLYSSNFVTSKSSYLALNTHQGKKTVDSIFCFRYLFMLFLGEIAYCSGIFNQMKCMSQLAKELTFYRQKQPFTDILLNSSEAHSKPSQPSKIERFEKIVNV